MRNHKKAVRALVPGQKEFSFVSAGADNMKKWQVCACITEQQHCTHAACVFEDQLSSAVCRVVNGLKSEIILDLFYKCLGYDVGST